MFPSLLAEVLLLGFEICYHFKYQFGLSSANFLQNIFKLLGGEMAYEILLTLVIHIIHMHLH